MGPELKSGIRAPVVEKRSQTSSSNSKFVFRADLFFIPTARVELELEGRERGSTAEYFRSSGCRHQRRDLERLPSYVANDDC